MRTNELKKIVEDMGYFVVTADKYEGEYFIIKSRAGVIYGTVYYAVENQMCTHNICPQAVAKVLLEYAYTSLEEREEEKKFYLMLPFGDELFLNLRITSNEFKISNKDEMGNYQTQFTQKEIDEMPFDTKFFEKVEVK